MNVYSFQVCNFKSIENSGEICLPKITLLIGPNSSGKSSIFQSLLLMKQTFEAQEPSMPLVLNGPYISLGEYSDFIHNKDHENCFWIKFNFKAIKFSTYECEVCGKTYKDKKNWYLNHIEKHHSKYWDMHKTRILAEKTDLTNIQSIKLNYSFDSETSIIKLKELEYENPYTVDGLILSLLKISQNDTSIQIEAISKTNITIYSYNLKNLTEKDSVDHSFFIKSLLDSLMRLRYSDLTKNDSNNERISVLDRDYGNVLKSRGDKEGLKTELNPESGIILDHFHKEIRPSTIDEKLALGLENRLFIVALSLRDRLEDIRRFLGGIHHVGPLRNWPERVYFGTGGKPISVGGKGEYTQEILWLDKRIGHENLTKKVNDWLIRLKLNIQLEIHRIQGDMYQLKVIQNGLSINAADVGFGISQILPILTECLDYSTKNSSRTFGSVSYYQRHMLYRDETSYKKIIICQQPEIHLNPRIQSELGDFFIQIEDPNLSLLIETHSEHILTRLQRRIAEGKLNPRDIVIYYISNEKNCSRIKNLSISSRGEFDYWPEGFFQDDYIDTVEILKAALGHQEGE